MITKFNNYIKESIQIADDINFKYTITKKICLEIKSLLDKYTINNEYLISGMMKIDDEIKVYLTALIYEDEKKIIEIEINENYELIYDNSYDNQNKHINTYIYDKYTNLLKKIKYYLDNYYTINNFNEYLLYDYNLSMIPIIDVIEWSEYIIKLILDKKISMSKFMEDIYNNFEFENYKYLFDKKLKHYIDANNFDLI